MTQPAPGQAGPEGVLTDVVLRTFRLNGMFLQVAESLAQPAGLTAAWWQVLGAVTRGPNTVSGVAREMGLARQSVQRVADLLVSHDLAEYQPNPAHARAKLLASTEAGRTAIGKLRDGTLAWAAVIIEAVGEDDLRHVARTMDALIAAVGKYQPTD
jgi:DNA-binding MarR family transcriptional regulator